VWKIWTARKNTLPKQAHRKLIYASVIPPSKADRFEYMSRALGAKYADGID